MFLVRNVFRTHPGKAKALVEIFKKAVPLLESSGVGKNIRVMTDAVAGFWTVVVEAEVEGLNTYLDMAKVLKHNPEVAEAMKGYIDHIDSGYREVFRLE